MGGSDKSQIIKCPNCGKMGAWLELPTMPFCSTRCKQLDQYKWFTEENVISSPLTPDMFDDPEFLDADELDK